MQAGWGKVKRAMTRVAEENIGDFKPRVSVRLRDMQSVLSPGKSGCYTECVVMHILNGMTGWRDPWLSVCL